jgi:hypothetical protein
VDGDIRTYRVPTHPSLLIQPGDLYPKYGTTVALDFNFQIKALNNQTTTDKLSFAFVNPQTKVFLNEERV